MIVCTKSKPHAKTPRREGVRSFTLSDFSSRSFLPLHSWGFAPFAGYESVLIAASHPYLGFFDGCCRALGAAVGRSDGDFHTQGLAQLDEILKTGFHNPAKHIQVEFFVLVHGDVAESRHGAQGFREV